MALLGAGVLLIVTQMNARVFEARVSGAVLSTFHLANAHTIRTAVIFPLRGTWVAYAISAACSAALLVSPFCLVSAGLIASGRTSVRRGLVTFGFLAFVLFVVNQSRLVLIAVSMRIWGFHHGFELSHVLFGSVLSTLGVLGGLLVFLRTALPTRPLEQLG